MTVETILEVLRAERRDGEPGPRVRRAAPRPRTPRTRARRPPLRRPDPARGRPARDPGAAVAPDGEPLEMRPGRIVVSGSVAYDYLMTFPGLFLDVVVPDRMHRLSVSFLVDEMRRVRGGVAPNIAFSLALLGERPLVVAAAGRDAADYRDWLGGRGRRRLGSGPLRRRLHGIVLRLDRPGPEPDRDVLRRRDGEGAPALLPRFRPRGDRPRRHRAERSRGDGRLREGVPRARHPVPLRPEPAGRAALRRGPPRRAGRRLDPDRKRVRVRDRGEEDGALRGRDPLARAGRRSSRAGEEGSTIALRGGSAEVPDGAVTHRIPPAALRGPAVDPTGVGDAFRAGLLAARRKGLSWEVAGRAGSVSAVYALETLGAQPAPYSRHDFVVRYRENFGADGIHAEIGRLAAP